MSKVLVIEDSLTQAIAIRKTLAELVVGVETTVVSNGSAAIKALHEVQPDIVVLDLNLPDMNGLEISRKLKSSLATRHITVIVHSVESRLTVFNAAFEAGADYYIPKGDSSLKNLASLVRGVLRRNGTLAETTRKLGTAVQMELAS